MVVVYYSSTSSNFDIYPNGASSRFLPQVNPRNGGEGPPPVLPLPDRTREESRFRLESPGHILDSSKLAPRPYDSDSPRANPPRPGGSGQLPPSGAADHSRR